MDWDKCEQQVFDLSPLWRDLEDATEGFGEATPHLLPADAGTDRDEKAEACDRFEARVDPILKDLETLDPVKGADLRARWEAWWPGVRAEAVASRHR
jgi:hypothetical protein